MVIMPPSLHISHLTFSCKKIGRIKDPAQSLLWSTVHEEAEPEGSNLSPWVQQQTRPRIYG